MSKSQFSPTYVMLGWGIGPILWDGANHMIRPADKYVVKTSIFITCFQRKWSCRHYDYQRLLGLLNFVVPLCRTGKLHLRLVIHQVSYCGIWIAKPHWRPASRIAQLVKIPLTASPMKLYYFRHSRQHLQ